MAEPLDPKEADTAEAVAISNMWEIAAIVELLEHKGLCTKQELYDIIEELRHRNPAALRMKAWTTLRSTESGVHGLSSMAIASHSPGSRVPPSPEQE